MSKKTKLSAFFDNGDDEPFPHKAVDDQKLTQYTTGTVRKTRREKERELAEAKQKEEEEHAARAYAEFLDEFEGEGSARAKSSQFVKAGQTEEPRAPPNRPTAPRANRFEQSNNPTPDIGVKPKGKRAMDAFLEEIKRDQAQREAKYSRMSHGQGRSVTAMAAYDSMGGSRDRGDSETCNLFVSNLPPHISEQNLGNMFATKGDVGSVKIMWPRNEPNQNVNTDPRKSASSRLSGFVSYMKRRDAEDALRAFDGYDWDGFSLKVGWSKAVPIAAKPLYPGSSRRREHHSRSRSRSRSPESSRRRHPHRRSDSRSRSRSRSPRRAFRSRSRSRDRRRRSPTPVLPNEDSVVTDGFIRAVAAEVKGHGSEYAEALKERERNNPKYAFMLQKHHKRHAFYRGLVERDDLEPEFNDDGYNSVYSTDSGEESERERVLRTSLGKLARKRFEAMLRAMSGKRGELARCMAFSLEHAEAATEVADIIISSLLVDGTPVPRKVARLHLICDILHNSAATVPSAWKFRQEFQSRLGIVFDHLSNIYHSFPGRITADIFKKQITSIVDIWEDWIVFPPDFTTELRQRLEGCVAPTEEEAAATPDVEEDANPAATSKFKTSGFKPAMAAAVPTAMEAQQSDIDIDGDAIVEDVDGEPMDMDDLDGVPMDDIDGEPIGDVDGEPMGIDGDGEPMVEEDLDGAPLDS